MILASLHVLARVLLVPGSILTLGAGGVFNAVKAARLVFIAATLGASAFRVGTSFARKCVARQIPGNAKFEAVDEAREEWKIAFRTRLAPVFPFDVLDYAFGRTKVSSRD